MKGGGARVKHQHRPSETSRRGLEALRKLYSPFFDSGWYYSCNPDVVEAGADALDHFILDGEAEGRHPSPYFVPVWVREQGALAAEARPLEAFLMEKPGVGPWPHPCIDTGEILRGRPDLTGRADALAALTAGEEFDRVCQWFSRLDYRALNPELGPDVHLEAHFLAHGIFQGCRPSAQFRIVRSSDFSHGPVRAQEAVASLRIHEDHWVVVRTGPGRAVMEQIRRHEALEPRLNAPGPLCLEDLPMFRADDLSSRDRIDVDALLDVVGRGADTVVVLPSLRSGGSEKYLVSLVERLAVSEGESVLVIVTGQTLEEATESVRVLWRRPLARADVVSFLDLAGGSWRPVWVLATLLMALEPRSVFVSNDEVGLACISTYGRSLGRLSTLVACFFSESPRAVGAPFSARYADRVIDHALLLSDNQRVFTQIRPRVAPSLAEGRMVVVPSRVATSDSEVRRAESAVRGTRRGGSQPLEVLWASRWDPFKDTAALLLLAAAHPELRISAHGPGTASHSGTLPANVRLLPPIANVESVDLSMYDCFLFTSQFEGMPNVVLEMVERGIPVVACDVGGLRETFDDEAVLFFSGGETAAETAASAGAALKAFEALARPQVDSMTAAARGQLMRRHSPEAYSAAVAGLLVTLDAEGAHDRV